MSMVGDTKIHRYSLSVLSGLLMVLSFPFTGSMFFLSFVAWVPLLLTEDIIARKKYRSGKVFLHAYIAFFIYNLGATWWIWNASLGGAAMAFFLNSFIMALVFLAYHLTKKYVGQKEGYISLLFYWLAFEFIHYSWELSWPWLNLGNVFSIRPEIVQWYNFFGVLGGTLWILLLNLILFRIVQNVYLKRESWKIQTPLFYIFAFFLIVPVSISLFQYFSYKETNDPMEVVVIQPNIDPYNYKFTAPVEVQLEKILNLADKYVTEKTEFVVAPETALPFPFYEEDFESMPVFELIKEHKSQWPNAALYIGASTYKHFEERNSIASRKYKDGPGFFENYNTSVLISSDNESSFLHKSKLVLGVEKIPFTTYFPFFENWAVEMEGGSGTLGIEKEPMTLRTKNTVFAPVICYESIYGGFVAQQCNKGAEVIFVITNDGWWEDTPGYKQHMSFARLRAIENRRDVARSANTGKSCFINQRGDVLEETAWWKESTIRRTLNKNKAKTVYAQYGDVLGRSFSFVALLLLIYTFAKRLMSYFASRKN